MSAIAEHEKKTRARKHKIRTHNTLHLPFQYYNPLKQNSIPLYNNRRNLVDMTPYAKKALRSPYTMLSSCYGLGMDGLLPLLLLPLCPWRWSATPPETGSPRAGCSNDRWGRQRPAWQGTGSCSGSSRKSRRTRPRCPPACAAVEKGREFRKNTNKRQKRGKRGEKKRGTWLFEIRAKSIERQQ